jgi:hypothetical protein
MYNAPSSHCCYLFCKSEFLIYQKQSACYSSVVVRRVKAFCDKYPGLCLSTVILLVLNFILFPAGNGVPVVLGGLFPVAVQYFTSCAGDTV